MIIIHTNDYNLIQYLLKPSDNQSTQFLLRKTVEVYLV